MTSAENDATRPCDACDGRGSLDGVYPDRCPVCKGAGTRPIPPAETYTREDMARAWDEGWCAGRGRGMTASGTKKRGENPYRIFLPAEGDS